MSLASALNEPKRGSPEREREEEEEKQEQAYSLFFRGAQQKSLQRVIVCVGEGLA